MIGFSQFLFRQQSPVMTGNRETQADVTLAYLEGRRQAQIAAEWCRGVLVYWFIGVLRGGRDWHTMRGISLLWHWFRGIKGGLLR
jgi:hypothetical protein